VENGYTPPVESFPRAVPFYCTVERGACTAWVQATGELDVLTSSVLERHLQVALAEARQLVLDLRQLTSSTPPAYASSAKHPRTPTLRIGD
jgi:hypothetical protein